MSEFFDAGGAEGCPPVPKLFDQPSPWTAPPPQPTLTRQVSGGDKAKAAKPIWDGKEDEAKTVLQVSGSLLRRPLTYSQQRCSVPTRSAESDTKFPGERQRCTSGRICGRIASCGRHILAFDATKTEEQPLGLYQNIERKRPDTKRACVDRF